MRPLRGIVVFLFVCSACGVISGLDSYSIRNSDGSPDLDASASSTNDASTTGDALVNPSDARPDQGSVDDAGTKDAALDASDGAPVFVADPGVVACNGSACSLDGGFRCCLDVSTPATCTPPSTMATCNGTEINCDEGIDCPTGKICCLQMDNGNPAWSTYCLASCAADHARVCKGPSDCPNAQPCLVISCSGRSLGTCAGKKPAACL